MWVAFLVFMLPCLACWSIAILIVKRDKHGFDSAGAIIYAGLGPFPVVNYILVLFFAFMALLIYFENKKKKPYGQRQG